MQSQPIARAAQIVMLLSFVLVLAFGGAANAQDEASFEFDIPAQPLDQAVTELARQAGLTIGGDADLLRGKQAPALKGEYTVREALRRLLDGTELQYRFTDRDRVTLSRADPAGDRLSPIYVEGSGVAPNAPAEGLVADFATTATKTATSIDDIPQSVSVVTRERLDLLDSETVSEAFRYVPGVQGESNGNDSRVDFLQFRGFNDDGNAVFRDGLQLRSSGFGQFFPELYGVQQVEVARGPASSLFGLANPGGVVNLVSKRPPAEALREVGIEFGSFDHREARFDIGGPVTADGGVAFRLTGLARDSDTQVDFVDDDRRFIAPSLTWRPDGDTRITALLRYQEDETGSTNQFLPADGTIRDNPNGEIDSDTFTGEPAFDRFDRDTYSLGYLFEHRFNDTWTVRQNARVDRLDVEADQIFGGGLQGDRRTLNRFAFTADAEVEGVTIDTQLQARLGSGAIRHKLLLGVDYQDYEFDDTQGFAFADPIDVFDPVFGAPIPATSKFMDTKTEQEQFGLYAQDQITVSEDWVVTLGGRQDEVDTRTGDRLAASTTDNSDSEFSGRAGLVYHAGLGLSPYIGYAESFLPTSGTDASGDPFDPTTSEQTEIGLRFTPPGHRLRLSLALFDLQRENVRTQDPNNPTFDIQKGEVESQGVEIEAQAALDSGVRFIAAYTHQDVEIVESNGGDEGNRPAGVPEERLSVWADYRLGGGALEGLRIGAGVRYQGDTFGDSANSFEVDGETLWDAGIKYARDGLRFSLDVSNLLDEEYIASCTSSAACFFGSRRDVQASVTYAW